MKIHFAGPKLLVFLVLILPASLAFAGDVIVDCSGATPGAFTALNDAIGSSPDHTRFLVSGTCTENLSIQGRNDLNFRGNPTATIQGGVPELEVMDIISSQRISFDPGFTFTGGQGIVITGSQNLRFNGITVQNSGSFGMTSADSLVHLIRSTITANTRTGIVVTGGAFYLDGGVNVTNNGRLGISAGTAHLSLNGSAFGANMISHNGLGGIQVFSVSQADLGGDNEITNNSGQFALLVLNSSGLSLSNGTINNNSGMGIHCGGTSHCELFGAHVDSNGGGGIEIVEHSDASLDGSMDISSNTGNGVLVDQSSSLTSVGGNTITNNTADGLVLNFLSALKFIGNDTITATAGNLALNCNNGSLVSGDVTVYKPRRCGAQFQTGPIH